MRYFITLLLTFLSCSAAVVTVTSSNSVAIVNTETWLTPSFTAQPSSVAVETNGDAAFSVTATGSLLSYQWRTNGAAVANGGRWSGARTSMLSLTGALIGDDGLLIDCVISNACSMPASSVATLTVTNGVGGGGGGGLLTDNLISFYRMDESSAGTRADAFGANDLTDVGVNVASAAGVINNSAAFDGGNKTLSHADNASLSMTSQSFTLQVFVKLGSVADNQHVVGKWGATGEYTIYITGDRFVFFRQDATGGGNGLVTATSFGAISTGVSYQVLAGQDTATGKLFIQVKTAGNEGTARDTTDYSDDGMDGAAAFTVGQFDGGGAILTGNVDLVGIWKRVITTTEATELFNGGAGRDPVTNP